MKQTIEVFDSSLVLNLHIRRDTFDDVFFNALRYNNILSDFFKAIKENEFVFYLQPQCRSSNGKIVGAEALARWKKRDGTLVPPDSFIPVLEKHGLITDLDMYIWEEVCKWIGKCIENGLTPVPISVNVSAIDILHSDITSIFDGLTRKYDISRDLIKIEITESAYMSNTEYINSVVQGLRQKGFLVMMDDFGSGYSSLNMLKSLSLDIVKLDAQFLRTENSDKTKSMHILESVASMTKTLELPIVVEGVESREQKDYLQNIGCSYMQGYYFYKPMPVADFEKLLSATDQIDSSGIRLKTNKQFRLQELLGEAIYSDNMLNNILGPCAFYLLHDDGQVDIVTILFESKLVGSRGDGRRAVEQGGVLVGHVVERQGAHEVVRPCPYDGVGQRHLESGVLLVQAVPFVAEIFRTHLRLAVLSSRSALMVPGSRMTWTRSFPCPT